ncbi:phosphotransferase, partial [Campylobacter coli]|nr:phosphotransferase [Campylobacter coli]
DKEIVKHKLESLNQIFFKSNKLKQYTSYITDILCNQLYLFDKYPFPIGYCHGDLTFSNILFQNQNIVLIDFLDNFIETPLQDVVKLRQDTRHKWSLKMTHANYDEIKIRIILSYLDCYIHKYFLKY